ncbi:alpha/beta hydrolase [Altererythrobacter salegens]|uniref:Alpha/beta hydrolase n=1 Tax=Croceibacterium salegens TaxID=1737568 RepID=A0A6I4SR45_9SPHN|nr:dienelactone hydrolase family protein [Croceibacterium salegens]MXO58441.1 alpha/beta hydrolase [Croceibacterium salegens]
MREAAVTLALLAASSCAPAPLIDRAPTSEAALPGGAEWSAIVPAGWNGILLLHSRGYSASAGSPEPAPRQYQEKLLAQGYALAASNYGAGGWALAEAVPAQEATIAAFAKRYGKPKEVIAYGFSMGGLVTTALAEKPTPSIDGAISFCGSIGGSIGMMNMGLDGAFTFKTLLAPTSAIELVGVADDRANGALVQAAVQDAKASAAGRARLVLAATLGGIPAWVPAMAGESPGDRQDREVDALIKAFPMGIFLPRSEQEQRTGIGYSWNEGIDYSALLARSGREDFVRSVYRSAGLDLAQDLEKLAQAPRIHPEQGAVDYMTKNYVPTAVPRIPMLAVQNLGDFVTSPSLQESYAERATPGMFKSLYLPQAGHCTFSADQMLDAISIVERRMRRGAWPKEIGKDVDLKPPPMPRGSNNPP